MRTRLISGQFCVFLLICITLVENISLLGRGSDIAIRLTDQFKTLKIARNSFICHCEVSEIIDSMYKKKRNKGERKKTQLVHILVLVLSLFLPPPPAVLMEHVTRLSLPHNRITIIPPSIANLVNLEILNLFNNTIEELPTSISSLCKLRILNVG